MTPPASSHPPPVTRGLPVPGPTERPTGGTIESPVVCFDRDPCGDPVIQLVIEHVASACVIVDRQPQSTCHTTFLRGVWVLPSLRRRGVGSALMRLISDAADDGDVVLALRPMPFDPPGPDTAEVSRWYVSFGFRALNFDPSLFVRSPRRWLE